MAGCSEIDPVSSFFVLTQFLRGTPLFHADLKKKHAYFQETAWSNATATRCYRYLQAHVSNLLDDPNIRGIVSSVRDVTERRRIEEELRFFRVLVENMLDFIAVLEPDTTARYLSPSVERVLGYRSEELVGTKMYDLVHPDDIERGMKDTAEVIGAPGPAGSLLKTRWTTRTRVQLS